MLDHSVHLLSDIKPKHGYMCEWWIVADYYYGSGNGTWVVGPNAEAFCSDKGGIISDPSITFWRYVNDGQPR